MMRYGAWLWLLVIVIAAIYLSFRAVTGIVLESNILALLPRAERDAAAQNVQDRIAESFSRRVIFLVGDASPEKSRRRRTKILGGARTFPARSPRSPRSWIRMRSSAWLRRIFPAGRGCCRTPTAQSLLAGQRKGAGFAGRSRSSMALAGSRTPSSSRMIRFCCCRRSSWTMPAPKSRFALDDGVLSVRSGGITYVLVSADLAGNPFSMNSRDVRNRRFRGNIRVKG